jgi:hypothetical protein
MNNDSMLDLLRTLECELHEPIARSNRQRLIELLHPEFREFGRSGAAYTLADILERLPAEVEPVRVHAQDFVAQPLSPSLVLLTYRSAHIDASGALERHTNRSSVWRLEPAGWQMVFHQGTATAAFLRSAPAAQADET